MFDDDELLSEFVLEWMEDHPDDAEEVLKEWIKEQIENENDYIALEWKQFLERMEEHLRTSAEEDKHQRRLERM